MYNVDIVNNGGYSFKVRANGFEFNIDAKGGAASPLDVFLASLGSCVGVYVRKYLEGVKIQLDKFSVEIESDMTKERPMHFADIKVSIRLEGIELDEQRKKSMLHFVKNCPIHNTLNLKPAINIEVL